MPALSIWRDLHHRLTQLAIVQGRSELIAGELIQVPVGHQHGQKQNEKLEALWMDTKEEDAILDICLERLGILIALREAPPDPPAPVRLTKKRRLETAGSVTSLDPSASPLAGSSTVTAVTSDPHHTESPASRTSSPVPLSSIPTVFTHTQTRSQLASRSSTPISDGVIGAHGRRDSGGGSTKAVFRLDRRITLRDQLPLLPGRLVAFKRPKKPSDITGSEEWIMAKVVKCICGDKNRYEVVDVDAEVEEDARMGKVGKKSSWNTTLKSIIPLPVKDQPDSYPSVPLLPGTAVLGLYPETTTFYRGRIKSGPSEKGKKYKVYFEDDDDTGAIPVIMEHVVPIQ